MPFYNSLHFYFLRLIFFLILGFARCAPVFEHYKISLLSCFFFCPSTSLDLFRDFFYCVIVALFTICFSSSSCVIALNTVIAVNNLIV